MKKCSLHYSFGFADEEKERLSSLLSGTEFESRVKGAYGCLTFSGREDYSVTVENYEGDINRTDNFQCTGMIPEWESAKNMNPCELYTIGYFKNPNGIITETSRL